MWPLFRSLLSDTTISIAEPGDPAGKRFGSVYPACGICGDAFTDTHSPILSTISANSSTRLPFGLHLPCPNQHSYCIGCLSRYIICKLDPDMAGGAREELIVFPIRCPECPSDQWLHGIPDDIAERILTEDRVALWVSRRDIFKLNVSSAEVPTASPETFGQSSAVLLPKSTMLSPCAVTRENRRTSDQMLTLQNGHMCSL